MSIAFTEADAANWVYRLLRQEWEKYTARNAEAHADTRGAHATNAAWEAEMRDNDRMMGFGCNTKPVDDERIQRLEKVEETARMNAENAKFTMDWYFKTIAANYVKPAL